MRNLFFFENDRGKKFGNGLITVAIYDLYSQKFISFLEHLFSLRLIIYTVGQLSIPHRYNKDINAVCASGIHYFLSLEAALNYYDGMVVQYFKDNTYCKYNEDGKATKISKFLAKIIFQKKWKRQKVGQW